MVHVDLLSRAILEGNAVKKAIILVGLLFVLVLMACSVERKSVKSSTRVQSQPVKELPQHTIESNTSLAPKDGRRIEIHVRNANLTKDECRLLINAYKNNAGSRGQVSVRKPNKNGEYLPWCVDNMDEKGITFNDFHFE